MHAMGPRLFNVCLALLSAIMFAPGSLQQQGSQIAPCIWQHINGSVININSVGSTNGTARWVDKETVDPETDPNLYSANPCYTFTQTSECQDVVACKTALLSGSFNIGDVGSSNMFYSSFYKAVILEYSHLDQASNVTKISQFVLACTEDKAVDQLLVSGSQGSTSTAVTYLFYLLSPCACYDGCPNATGPTLGPAPSPTISMQPIATPTVTMIPIATTVPTIKPLPPSKSISPGGIICIIFVCTVGAYFLIGAAYMFCCAGARGKEIIPNVDFWMTFCSLVLEGCEFLCSCCSSAPRNPPLSSQEQTTTTDYDKI